MGCKAFADERKAGRLGARLEMTTQPQIANHHFSNLKKLSINALTNYVGLCYN